MATTKVIEFPGAPAAPQEKESNGRRKKRTDGRQQISYVDDRGKRHFFYGKTLKEATKKMDEDKAQRAQGVDPSAGRNPLDKWAARWLEVYGQNAGYSANRTNKANVDRLVAALGKTPIRDITEADIQAFANAQAHYSKSTVQKIKIVVNGIFERAMINRLIPYSPCAGVTWPHKGEGTHRALAEYERLLITDNWREHRAGLWAAIMLWAGLRIGEVLALSWDDIDIEKGEIHVHTARHFEGNVSVDSGTTKTGVSRTVPIFPPLRQILEAVPFPPVSALVCASAQREVVTNIAMRRNWTAFLNTLSNILNGDTKDPVSPGRRSDKDKDRYKDIPRIKIAFRTHDLRHTFCTMLYDAGVDVKTAQVLMGHKTLDMLFWKTTFASQTSRLHNHTIRLVHHVFVKPTCPESRSRDSNARSLSECIGSSMNPARAALFWRRLGQAEWTRQTRNPPETAAAA